MVEKNETPELTAEQLEQQLKKKKQYCDHLQIKYEQNINFIEVEYSSKKGFGRTIMALDPFIIHIRSVGDMAGKVWDELLGLFVEKETKFDVNIVRFKHQVTGIDLERKEKENDGSLESLTEGIDHSNIICNVFIHFGPQNSFTITGLDEITAMDIKQKLLNWTLSIY